MTKNQVAGSAVLSIIPIGMLTLAILTGSVGEFLVGTGITVVVASIVFVGTGFLNDWGR